MGPGQYAREGNARMPGILSCVSKNGREQIPRRSVLRTPPVYQHQCAVPCYQDEFQPGINKGGFFYAAQAYRLTPRATACLSPPPCL